MHVCVRTGRTSTSTGEQALWGQDVYFARCVLAAVFALGKRSDAVEPCNLTPAWGSIPAIQDSEETEMQRGPPRQAASHTHERNTFTDGVCSVCRSLVDMLFCCSPSCTCCLDFCDRHHALTGTSSTSSRVACRGCSKRFGSCCTDSDFL